MAVVCSPLKWMRLQIEACYQDLLVLVEPGHLENTSQIVAKHFFGGIVAYPAVFSPDILLGSLDPACTEGPWGPPMLWAAQSRLWVGGGFTAAGWSLFLQGALLSVSQST